MALVYPEITFAYVISLIAGIYGLALLIFLRELRKRPETVMARFKLNREKTTTDFRNMLAGNIVLAFSMVLLLAASISQNEAILNISYTIQILSSSVIVYTISTWVREYAIK